MRWLVALIVIVLLATALWTLGPRSRAGGVEAPSVEPRPSERADPQLEPVTEARLEAEPLQRTSEVAADEPLPSAVVSALLSGRVVDSRGQGVRASVRLWQRDAAESIEHGARCRTDRDGSFQVGIDPEREWQLAAEALGHGTGHTPWRRGAEEQVEIVVTGSAALRGTLRDPDGSPLPGVKLWVLLAELHESLAPDKPNVFTSEQVRPLWIEGRGTTQAVVETSADGEFAADGLQLGSYMVRVHGETPTNPRTPYRFPDLLTSTPIESNGVAVSLTMEATILTVQLFDNDGTATGAEPSIVWDGALDVPRTWFGNDWNADRPILSVDPSWSVGRIQSTRRSSLGGRMLDSGLAVFDVTPVRSTVWVRGGGFDNDPYMVELPEGRRTHVEFTRQARARGKLEITSDCDNAQYSLVDAATGLVFREYFTKEGALLIEAPPGDYVIRGTCEEDTVAPGEFPHAQQATLEPNQTTHVDFRSSRQGEGFIELTLLGDTAETDERGRTVRVAVQAPPLPARLLRPSQVPSWTLGESAVSYPVPPGSYELLAELPDGRQARQSIELQAGETLRVSLDFDD